MTAIEPHNKRTATVPAFEINSHAATGELLLVYAGTAYESGKAPEKIVLLKIGNAEISVLANELILAAKFIQGGGI